MSDKKELLGKYRKKRTPYPELVKSDNQSQNLYRAFEEIKATDKKDIPKDIFRIYDKDGDFDFYEYSRLLKGSFKKGAIILPTMTDIITLKGQNLRGIAELFSLRKIKAVYEFNPATHQPPAAGEPLIERIDWE